MGSCYRKLLWCRRLSLLEIFFVDTTVDDDVLLQLSFGYSIRFLDTAETYSLNNLFYKQIYHIHTL